jgi:broad specificity phosphatase PhoE
MSGAGSSVVKAVEGFFAHKGPAAAEVSLFRHFKRAPPSWEALQQQVEAMAKSSRNVKVVYFVRHAQGAHNVAWGMDKWDELARSDEFLDPDLTPFGVQDARAKGPPNVQAEMDHGMPPIERVVVSPLSRSIQTAHNFFSKAQVPADTPLLCMESCREVLDCCTFDKRRSLSELKHKFPDVDFSRIQHEQDVLWSPTHYETDDEMHARARSFLAELFAAVPERYVVVVSHVCFIQAVYAVTTGAQLSRPDNCDVVPLVLEAS